MGSCADRFVHLDGHSRLLTVTLGRAVSYADKKYPLEFWSN
jgi:hypothetical protein